MDDVDRLAGRPGVLTSVLTARPAGEPARTAASGLSIAATRDDGDLRPGSNRATAPTPARVEPLDGGAPVAAHRALIRSRRRRRCSGGPLRRCSRPRSRIAAQTFTRRRSSTVRGPERGGTVGTSARSS